MGLNRVRVDSVAKLQKKKTMAELQDENEALKTKVSSLETNLDNTQMALCDVYEQTSASVTAGVRICFRSEKSVWNERRALI